MSYPAFGKVKTIVLPCLLEDYLDQSLTIEEYKNKFGIDLRDILYIADDVICLKANAQILLQPYKDDATTWPYLSCLMPIMKYRVRKYTSELGAGLSLYVVSEDGSDYFGIYFFIKSNTEMKVENIKVTFIAI